MFKLPTFSQPISGEQTFTLEIAAQPGKALTMGGLPSTVEAIVASAATAAAGDELRIGYGENILAMVIGASGASLTINSTHTEALGASAHLDLSEMACCIGDACIMWPPPPAADVPQPSTFTLEIAAQPGKALTMGGLPSTVEAIVASAATAAAGDELRIGYGENILAMVIGASGASLTINSTHTEALGASTHLDLSEMACCIGDACIMWPPPPAADPPQQIAAQPGKPLPKQCAAGITWPPEAVTEPSAPPAHPEVAFLGQIASLLGDDKMRRLVELVDASAELGAPAHLEAAVATWRASGSDGASSPLTTIAAQERHGDVILCHSADGFNSALKEATTDLVVVDFMAVWCAPCKQVAPHYERMATELKSSATFLKVDIQEGDLPLVANHYGVQRLPYFGVLRRSATDAARPMDAWREVAVKTDSSNFQQLATLVMDAASASSSAASAAAEAPKASKYPRATDSTVYDLIVIGGGSGGMAAAKAAAALGKSVALFDFVKPSTQGTTWGFGGTCVNVGCVPKKLMHYAATLGEKLRHEAEPYGHVVRSSRPFDWKRLVQTVQEHVGKLNFSYQNGVKDAGKREGGSIDLYNALAHLLGGVDGARQVRFEDGLGVQGTVIGKAVLLAAGGRPYIDPAVPGAVEHSITSDDIFSLDRAPGKTLIVGGGYIALECAGFLAGLGFDVTVSIRSIALRGFDRQCADKCAQSLALVGATLLWQSDILEIRKLPSGKLQVRLHLGGHGEQEHTFDTVIYATGRSADTSKLGLEALGIATTKSGKVVTTEGTEATNVSGVYAIGDLSDHGKLELTPVAIQAGQTLIRRLFAAELGCEPMNYNLVATTIFTPAEYGCVGLSEEEATAKHSAELTEVFLSEFSSLEASAVHRSAPACFNLAMQSWPPDDATLRSSDRYKQTQAASAGTDADDEPLAEPEVPPNCLAKVVCVWSAPPTEEQRAQAAITGAAIGRQLQIVGFHFVGPNAGEVIQAFALALRGGVTKWDLDSTVGIHPTDAEAFTTLEVTRRACDTLQVDWVSTGGCGGSGCG